MREFSEYLVELTHVEPLPFADEDAWELHRALYKLVALGMFRFFVDHEDHAIREHFIVYYVIARPKPAEKEGTVALYPFAPLQTIDSGLLELIHLELLSIAQVIASEEEEIQPRLRKATAPRRTYNKVVLPDYIAQRAERLEDFLEERPLRPPSSYPRPAPPKAPKKTPKRKRRHPSPGAQGSRIGGGEEVIQPARTRIPNPVPGSAATLVKETIVPSPPTPRVPDLNLDGAGPSSSAAAGGGSRMGFPDSISRSPSGLAIDCDDEINGRGGAMQALSTSTMVAATAMAMAKGLTSSIPQALSTQSSASSSSFTHPIHVWLWRSSSSPSSSSSSTCHSSAMASPCHGEAWQPFVARDADRACGDGCAGNSRSSSEGRVPLARESEGKRGRRAQFVGHSLHHGTAVVGRFLPNVIAGDRNGIGDGKGIRSGNGNGIGKGKGISNGMAVCGQGGVCRCRSYVRRRRGEEEGGVCNGAGWGWQGSGSGSRWRRFLRERESPAGETRRQTQATYHRIGRRLFAKDRSSPAETSTDHISVAAPVEPRKLGDAKAGTSNASSSSSSNAIAGTSQRGNDGPTEGGANGSGQGSLAQMQAAKGSSVATASAGGASPAGVSTASSEPYVAESSGVKGKASVLSEKPRTSSLPASTPSVGPVLSITIMGSSGELALNKILPALFALHYQGWLPKNFYIFGYGRREMSDEEMRSLISERLTCRLDEGTNCAALTDEFLARCFYQPGEYDSCEGMKRLNERISECEGDNAANRIFYLSVPPPVAVQVAQCLNINAMQNNGWSRVILEKPFGRDAVSSAKMTKELLTCLTEEQIYRIDQHMGKELIENLAVLRFSNLIFEPLWCRQYIRNVQVIYTEGIGIEGRGKYFHDYGIVRDIVQLHLLQIIALFAMEPPVSLDPEDIRNEKVKVLRSMRTPTMADAVLGQYKAGAGPMGTQGYVDDPDVPSGSLTPTFFAGAVFIDNARWDGVPFLIKAGNALDQHKEEIRIQFRHVPGNLYRERFGSNMDKATNELLIRVFPDEGIFLKINNKIPGLGIQLDSSFLNLHFRERYNGQVPDSYERLLLDVIEGDKQLFIRSDELQAAWDVITPLLQEVEDNKVQPELYSAGSRGPVGAYYLGAKHNVRWANFTD
ncbi:hypothetical protein CBR_g40141 [Chara braunii]|uniref:Glucose-6-phosphate 1-dehydrogenase n=1 Tax=Chara braunii TaxID=69332 RepID=A0A388LTG1_CHABU|nr:hypothetical protein CBR_g40141 [Chara braunii]|eukprot:GBG85502.1 hypothetical protein CBR_g40141 [Chara braunii]